MRFISNLPSSPSHDVASSALTIVPLATRALMKLSGLAFRLEHGRDRVAVALANDDDDLALAVLILREATVAAVLLVVRRLDVAAEIAAVDFGDLALAADDAALHFLAPSPRGACGSRTKAAL